MGREISARSNGDGRGNAVHRGSPDSIAMEMLADLEKDTVAMMSNYDETPPSRVSSPVNSQLIMQRDIRYRGRDGFQYPAAQSGETVDGLTV